jgi:hypothetical protein
MRKIVGSRRSGRTFAAVVAATVVAAFAALVTAAPSRSSSAAVQDVTLELSGSHPADLTYHVGTFTATAPLCPKGKWEGDSEEEGEGLRVFTCANGSGTFTADFVGDSEHYVGNSDPRHPGSGPWAISEGTGKWKKLRGKGTATTLTSSGPDSSPIVFTSEWKGSVDFDTTGPTVKVVSVKVKRAATRRGTSALTVSFTARDNVRTNQLTYRVTATSGQYFNAKLGSVSGAKTTIIFAVNGREADRTLELNLHVFDPWLNETLITKTVKLR